MNFNDLANPERFERIAKYVQPVLALIAAVLAGAGLYYALFNSPPDYQQGDSVRIMYVHVPSAWMALFCYSIIAGASATGFIWKHPLADVTAKATAPIGAVFTGLALFTGSIWGKPMWGAWWAWDARLTSMLILFFLYLGYLAIWETVEDKTRAARLAAVVAIVGFVNIPIIHFSVDWWNSLHQPASIFRPEGPTVAPSMLTPLFLMALAYTTGYGAMVLASIRNELIARRLQRLRDVAGRKASTVEVR